MRKMKKKLYLDIDGVLITSKDPSVPDGMDEFIQFITSNFDCYWLTTHCKGDANRCIQYLKSYFSDNILDLMAMIKPTNWNTLKTEAINLFEPFVWLDDYPMMAEKIVLESAKKSDCLITVNLNNAEELKRITDILRY